MEITGDTRQAFLFKLADATQSDPERQASMYDIGQSLGLDRNQSQRLVEDLVAEGFVEIRSLSGGVGLTSSGAEVADKTTGSAEAGGDRISGEPILTESDQTVINSILVHLHSQAGELSWNFDLLTDLMADIKTIDAQLKSNRPKLAIIRECFRSIHTVLDLAGVSPDKSLKCLLPENASKT